MEKEGKRFFGKYRGTVLNNVDPLQEGRIQVQVPDVTGIGISIPRPRKSGFRNVSLTLTSSDQIVKRTIATR